MTTVEVHKVIVDFQDGEKKEYTVDEFILIPPASRVLFTTGENKITYYDKDNNVLSQGKSIVCIGKKRRTYLDSIGENY